MFLGEKKPISPDLFTADSFKICKMLFKLYLLGHKCLLQVQSPRNLAAKVAQVRTSKLKYTPTKSMCNFILPLLLLLFYFLDIHVSNLF